ncbi:MAG: Ferredoxin, 2Fe-2S, partial [uncultured Sphingomonas sp.]
DGGAVPQERRQPRPGDGRAGRRDPAAGRTGRRPAARRHLRRADELLDLPCDSRLGRLLPPAAGKRGGRLSARLCGRRHADQPPGLPDRAEGGGWSADGADAGV